MFLGIAPKRVFLLAGLFLLAAELHALSFKPRYSELGFGLNNSYLKKIQVDEAGTKNTLKLRPYFSGALRWQLPQQFLFAPELRIGLPYKGRDEQLKKLEWTLQLPVVYLIRDYELRFGPGLYWTRLWGPGGVQELDNGLGVDSFFMPSEAQTALNLTWMLGVDYTFLPAWSVRFDLQAFNLVESERRAFSQTLSLHYHFDLFVEAKE